MSRYGLSWRVKGRRARLERDCGFSGCRTGSNHNVISKPRGSAVAFQNPPFCPKPILVYRSFAVAGSSTSAIRDRVFLNVEADFGFGGQRRRLKEGTELLKDLAKGDIVDQERLINLGQTFQNGRVGRDVLAHFDEGANDIYAHRHGTRAVEDVGSHERP